MMVADRTEKLILARLFELRDPGYAAFQSKLIPNVPSESIIGVRTPELRRFAKELSADRAASSDFLSLLPHAYYEENNLHAMLIERLDGYEETVRALDSFLPFVDNWATCDTMNPKILGKRLPELRVKTGEWIATGRIYTVRFAVGALMRFFLGDAFTPDVLTDVCAIRSEEYYVNMMVAWFFATALAKQPEAAFPYIERRLLPVWTHNMTIRKAVESFRITEEDKARLRSLKI